MSSRTIIHIGLHKTASTLLQEKVFPKVRGFRYLTRPYTQINRGWNQLQYADDTFYDEDFMNKTTSPFRDENLLISDESLTGNPAHLAYSNRSMIAKRLKKQFPEAEIILFIRGQQDIICSQYNMWVKGSYNGYANISDFLWIPEEKVFTLDQANSHSMPGLEQLFINVNKPYLHAVGYKYYELVKLYKSLFEKVHVLLFEDISANSEDVAARLCRIFDQPELIDKSDFAMRVNKSLTKEELRKKLIENKVSVVAQKRPVRWFLKKYLQYFSDPVIDPEKYVEEKTKDFYKEDNRRLIDEFPEIGIDRFPEKYRV